MSDSVKTKSAAQDDAPYAVLQLENAKLTARIEKLNRDLVRAREKKRFEAACFAMQGMLAGCQGTYGSTLTFECLPAMAVNYADALLAALSESKEGE